MTLLQAFGSAGKQRDHRCLVSQFGFFYCLLLSEKKNPKHTETEQCISWLIPLSNFRTPTHEEIKHSPLGFKHVRRKIACLCAIKQIEFISARETVQYFDQAVLESKADFDKNMSSCSYLSGRNVFQHIHEKANTIIIIIIIIHALILSAAWNVLKSSVINVLVGKNLAFRTVVLGWRGGGGAGGGETHGLVTSKKPLCSFLLKRSCL